MSRATYLRALPLLRSSAA